MRSPDDARRDPRPGDSSIFYGLPLPLARVDVTNILDDGSVQGLMDGRIQVTYTMQQWQKWMANAEVLHVAQEGGEG